MKKLLLASAALVLSGGMAAAQGVTLAGDARMGVVYVHDYALDGTAPLGWTRDSGFAFSSRARVQFRLDGTTSTGLAFGARFRAHQGAAAVGNRNMTGGEVFISGTFGRLAMGDVDSAAQDVSYNLPHIGYSELNGANSPLNSRIDFIESEATGALYTYDLDAFSFALGIGQLNRNETWSIGFGYEMDGYGIALAHERVDVGGYDAHHTVLSGEASFDPVTVTAFYGRLAEGGDRWSQYGLAVAATFDEVTVIARGKRDFDDRNHYGLGVNYDLGGGASLRAGVNREPQYDPFGDYDQHRTVGDFGVVMSF